MNSLTKIGVGIFAIIIAFSMMSQCGRKNPAQEARVTQSNPAAVEKTTEVVLKEYSKGLNLDAVTLLAKKAKDAADFELLLNTQSEGVNNLDLNDDKKVDYIKVSEYGSGDQRGFSLTTELEPGKVQEIATIEIKREADKATVQTTGNPSLYGPAQYHHSSFGLTDMLLMGWLFSSNRPSYSSPYGYGNYPPSYGGGWNRQAPDSYEGTMKSRTAGSTIRTSKQSVIQQPAVSPNAEKIAAKSRALANPTQSQRSFGSPSGSTSGSQRTSGTASNSRPGTSSNTSTAPSRPTSSFKPAAPSRPSSSGGFGRSSSSGSSRSGGFSRGGK
ncbi:hypothetical protein JIN84_18840 [Luteolibacter yonseiensis]|uniref:Uncharacterized protein n=1 Tax=Luteolibacter yonseiensis TaxID=1144680 RepID=A0A934R3F6_9BACT|nr:hypothetical protein [Luteolibacter yonseiensis]MBK1817683.1 hypothetical protein [Luteolibacter yonseiensis]